MHGHFRSISVRRLPADAQLYHWAPRYVRTDVQKNGLLIAQRSHRGPTLNGDGSEWFAPYLCFGISPADAWAWGNLTDGEYDLWQVQRAAEDKVVCRRDGGVDIIEVRIHNNINPQRLWRVGTRFTGRH